MYEKKLKDVNMVWNISKNEFKAYTVVFIVHHYHDHDLCDW